MKSSFVRASLAIALLIATFVVAPPTAGQAAEKQVVFTVVVSPTRPVNGEIVRFDVTSVPSNEYFFMDFGDGLQVILSTPTTLYHVYATGHYTWELFAMDNPIPWYGFIDSVSQPVYSIVVTKTEPLVGEVVGFVIQFVANGDEWMMDYGDGPPDGAEQVYGTQPMTLTHVYRRATGGETYQWKFYPRYGPEYYYGWIHVHAVHEVFIPTVLVGPPSPGCPPDEGC